MNPPPLHNGRVAEVFVGVEVVMEALQPRLHGVVATLSTFVMVNIVLGVLTVTFIVDIRP